MEIIRKPLGLYKTNCYVLIDHGMAVIIDPGFHGNRIIEELGTIEPLAILLTHGHADHICAVDTIAEHYEIPVYMNPHDDELLRVKRRMPSAYQERFHSPYHPLQEGPLEIGPFRLEIIETPGHSTGSVFIVYQQHVFTGDTLFQGTVGKTTTYNGDDRAMEETLQRIAGMQQSYVLYPGHGPSSTLREEQSNNPFLQLYKKNM